MGDSLTPPCIIKNITLSGGMSWQGVKVEAGCQGGRGNAVVGVGYRGERSRSRQEGRYCRTKKAKYEKKNNKHYVDMCHVTCV